MSTPRPLHLHQPPPSDRLLVILSDIEMGAGGVQDDFPHSDFLGELILSYNEPPFAEVAIDLIFNGDTFDLLKTPYLDRWPHLISRDVALGKMARVAAAHPRFFEGVRRFLQHPGAARRVYFVTGNHDAELVFPEVRQFIASLCGPAEQVRFPGFFMRAGRVHIEHGSQRDPMFRVDEDKPLVEFDGEEVLNISWGSVALLETVMSLHPLLYVHDRLTPKDEVFKVLPELRELGVDAMWKYWTRDYWKGYFGGGDPTKKVSWRLVKELMSRYYNKNTEIELETALMEQLRERDDVLLYVIGHTHLPGVWTYGDRKLMQAGCLRNEYMPVDEGKTLRAVPKNFIEVYLRDEAPVRSSFVEVEAPEPPPGYVPESIFDVMPQVREMLAANQGKDQQEQQQARREQEKREAAEEREAARSAGS